MTKNRVRVNQWLYFPLSLTDFLLLAWYQQAGRWRKAAESGKYVDVSGKWSRYFTLTPKNTASSFFKDGSLLTPGKFVKIVLLR